MLAILPYRPIPSPGGTGDGGSCTHLVGGGPPPPRPLPRGGGGGGGSVVAVAGLGPGGRLAPPLAGHGFLALALDRGLLIEGAPLHLLEDAVLEQHLLEALERRLDLVVEDLDLHE